MMTPNNKENAKANILAMFDEDSSVDGDSPKSALRAKTPKTPGSAKPRTPGSKPCSDDIVAITDFDVAASPAPEKAPAAPVAVVSAERPTPERPERPERPTPERRSLLASKDELVVTEVIMEEPASPDAPASPLPAPPRLAPMPAATTPPPPAALADELSSSSSRGTRAALAALSPQAPNFDAATKEVATAAVASEPPKKGSPSPSKKGRGWKLSFPRFSRAAKATEETVPPVEVSVVETSAPGNRTPAPTKRGGKARLVTVKAREVEVAGVEG